MRRRFQVLPSRHGCRCWHDASCDSGAASDLEEASAGQTLRASLHAWQTPSQPRVLGRHHGKRAWRRGREVGWG
jgi:hypothetical protein